MEISTLDARLESWLLLFQAQHAVDDGLNYIAPDDESIGIEYYQKISEKVSLIPISILHTKSIVDTIGSNTNTAILTTLLTTM